LKRKKERELKKEIWLTMIMLAAVTLACNLPGRAEAEPEATLTVTTETGMALAPDATDTPGGLTVETPTPTQEPGITPSPTVCGYDSAFVTDITIPDGTELLAGESFNKKWRVQNNGCLDWGAGIQLVHVGGDVMGGPSVTDVAATAVGATVDIEIPLNAPDTAGDYSGYWQLRDPEGKLFGQKIFVIITVIEPTPTPAITPTVTPSTPTGTPHYDPFVGTWLNTNSATTEVTKVKIRVDGDTIYIHMWAACSPDDCDWGETTTTVEDSKDGVLSISWSDSERTETQQLSILLDGRLQVAGQIDYTDAGKLDRNYTEYFNKE
jgi:hypothetical protein